MQLSSTATVSHHDPPLVPLLTPAGVRQRHEWAGHANVRVRGGVSLAPRGTGVPTESGTWKVTLALIRGLSLRTKYRTPYTCTIRPDSLAGQQQGLSWPAAAASQ